MTHRACEDCEFWDNSTQLANAESDTTGQCRFNPPDSVDLTGAAIFPFTEFGDWCGSFVAGECPTHKGPLPCRHCKADEAEGGAK